MHRRLSRASDWDALCDLCGSTTSPERRFPRAVRLRTSTLTTRDAKRSSVLVGLLTLSGNLFLLNRNRWARVDVPNIWRNRPVSFFLGCPFTHLNYLPVRSFHPVSHPPLSSYLPSLPANVVHPSYVASEVRTAGDDQAPPQSVRHPSTSKNVRAHPKVPSRQIRLQRSSTPRITAA